MTTIRLSKEFNFDMAHALLNYDGPCRNIHGHSYTLVVTVKGEPIHDQSSSKNGMLIDFGDLKKIVKENIVKGYDHALVLNEGTPAEVIGMLQKHFDKIVLTPYQPTTENMLADFADRIKGLLPSNLALHSLKLRETETSFGEWFAEDN